MAALIKWNQPRSVSDWELKHEVIPQLKKTLFLFWKWAFILGLPFLYVVWRWLPEDFSSIFYRLLVLSTVLLPTVFGSMVWLGCKSPTSFRADSKGLVRIGGNSNRRYRWKEIDEFRFINHPHVPNVRCLAFKVRQGKRQQEQSFKFSPSEVSEQELAEVLHQHLVK